MSELSIVEEFNTSIKFLGRAYVAKKKGQPDEAQVVRNNKRMLLVINADPALIIREAGPHILKYADMIHARDWNGLINADFSEDVKSLTNQNGASVNNDIAFIKRLFASCSETEKNRLGDHMQTLLSAYCKYAILKKRS